MSYLVIAFIFLCLLVFISVIFFLLDVNTFEQVFIYILVASILAYLVACYLNYKGYFSLNENLVYFIDSIFRN